MRFIFSNVLFKIKIFFICNCNVILCSWKKVFDISEIEIQNLKKKKVKSLNQRTSGRAWASQVLHAQLMSEARFR